MLSRFELKIAKQIAERNIKILATTGRYDSVVSFTHKSIFIHNPFVDETKRYEVNPVVYYGIKNLRKFIREGKKFL